MVDGCVADAYRFTATLTGAQVVPTAVTTNARGTGVFTYDDSSHKLFYDVVVEGFTSTITQYVCVCAVHCCLYC
jgi:hypothetical protein